jgi:hypothetical protein
MLWSADVRHSIELHNRLERHSASNCLTNNKWSWVYGKIALSYYHVAQTYLIKDNNVCICEKKPRQCSCNVIKYRKCLGFQNSAHLTAFCNWHASSNIIGTLWW